MKIGIVGNGSDKFTPAGRQQAIDIICILVKRGDTVVSGHSPMGGVDIWAEEEADEHKIRKLIFAPKNQRWTDGYRDRNVKIAENSDEVHVIVADKYPQKFIGKKFKLCYHCLARSTQDAETHVKSGACWTAMKAIRMGKLAVWHIVRNE